MNVDGGEGAGGEEEEEWEEEYVMLDLDDVFHGAPIRNFTYTLTVSNKLEMTFVFEHCTFCHDNIPVS